MINLLLNNGPTDSNYQKMALESAAKKGFINTVKLLVSRCHFPGHVTGHAAGIASMAGHHGIHSYLTWGIPKRF